MQIGRRQIVGGYGVSPDDAVAADKGDNSDNDQLDKATTQTSEMSAPSRNGGNFPSNPRKTFQYVSTARGTQ